MGRIGISYLEVANVATELQGKGINPTVDNVRDRLGTGSRSTIGPYLKQWRSKQETFHGIHSGLPPELSSLVKGLYERLQDEANLKISAIEEQARNEIAALQQRCVELAQMSLTLEADKEVLSASLSQSKTVNEALKLELDSENKTKLSLETKINEFETRIEDKEKQLQILEKQFDHLQSNLEHYRSSVQAQREEEKLFNERMIAVLQQESNDLKNQILLLSKSNSDFNKMINELNTLNLDLNKKMEMIVDEKEQTKKEWYEQRSKTMELQEQIKLKDFIVKTKEDQYNHLLDESRINQERYFELQNSFHKYEKDCLLMEEKLNRTEHLLSIAKDKINELQSDRIPT